MADDNVVPFPGKTDPGYATCECGSAWFHLVDGQEHGSVCVTSSGSVTGYTGVLTCDECDRPFYPAGGIFR